METREKYNFESSDVSYEKCTIYIPFFFQKPNNSVHNFVLEIYLIIGYRCGLIFRNETIPFCWISPPFQIPNSMKIFVSTILDFVCIFYERQFKLRSSFSTCFPISFPVYQKLILSRFVARGSKHEIVPDFEKKKRRDKYCKYNIISMQP